MGLRIRPGIRRAFRLALRRRDLTEREVEEELRTHFALRVAQASRVDPVSVLRGD